MLFDNVQFAMYNMNSFDVRANFQGKVGKFEGNIIVKNTEYLFF